MDPLAPNAPSQSQHTSPVAAHIARATNGTVILVQIATLPFTYSPYLGSATYTDEAIKTDLKAVERYLNAIANSELLAGIKTTTKAILGSAAPEILSTANTYNIDLIVMTSQGKAGMKRWMLGSVAQKIARYCAMPVLVLHEKGPLPVGPHPDNRPFRALVPLDGSTLAKTAREPAAQLVAAIRASEQTARLSFVATLACDLRPSPVCFYKGFCKTTNDSRTPGLE